eukprot:209425-Chlamydomonas_euryale.AAC.2
MLTGGEEVVKKGGKAGGRAWMERRRGIGAFRRGRGGCNSSPPVAQLQGTGKGAQYVFLLQPSVSLRIEGAAKHACWCMVCDAPGRSMHTHTCRHAGGPPYMQACRHVEFRSHARRHVGRIYMQT